MATPFITQFQRTTRRAIDASSVSPAKTAFDQYVATGPSYPGQVIAVFPTESANEADLFKINRDGAAVEVKTGGQELDPLSRPIINGALVGNNFQEIL